MSSFWEHLKRTALYKHSFCLRYILESLAIRIRRRTFAEYGEDLMVESLLGQAVEFFIDVGASDGFHSSNTLYFALRGARGVCFEPIPESYSCLRSLYLFNHKVRCLRYGLSDENKNATMVALQGLSYLPETQDLGHKRLHQAEHPSAPETRDIRLLRFQDAIAGLGVPRVVDLLTVDVEGHELRVLQSIPFDLYQFRVIIVETHHLRSDRQYLWKHCDHDRILALLEGWHYRPVQRTTANTIFMNADAMPINRKASLAAVQPSP